MARTIAMLPTYNEAENIVPLIDAILALGPELEVLVVDDDSPDGTWRLVRDKKKAEANPRIHLLHRLTRRGRGLAGIAGFCEALRIGADAVVEMDADWSHDPRWIPALLEKSRDADVVIGSRLVPGGGEQGRGAPRRWITQAANAYIRLMLGLPVRDATSGYRLFSRRCLEALPWDAMRSTGPEIVQEVLLAAHARGFKMVETPILFVDRRHGQSTFNGRTMLRSLKAVWRLHFEPGRLVPLEDANTADRFTPSRQKLTPLPTPMTLPLSWIYGLGRRAHRAWNVWGPVRRQRLPAPVVCVGNLTVGGTGKTPFVRFMAEALKSRGFRPAIVSRGYRSEPRLKRPLIVSNGLQVLSTGARAGDEPQWLAEHCPGVPVIVHPDRHAAAMVALRQLDVDLIVLDDGFQHDRLRRNLDLVLWDACDEPARMRLMPAGRLREGLHALRRADAIILTHGEYLPDRMRPARLDRVIEALKRHAPTVAIFESETKIVGFRRLSGRLRQEGGEVDEAHNGAWPWSGRRVLAISGLARPQGFETMIRASGAQVIQHFAYADHFTYHEGLVDRWRAAIARYDAEMILTTTKDAVKLNTLPLFGLPVVAVAIEMGIKDAERWEAFLDQRLRRLRKLADRARSAQ